MINFQNVDLLNNEIRKILIKQSELLPERVLNSTSLYGTDLDELLEDSVYTSIEQNSETLLFELIDRTSTADFSEEEEEILQERLTVSNYIYVNGLTVSDDSTVVNDNITFYKAYQLKVLIYGNNSPDLANKIIARLRTETVRNEFYSKGIYLEKVSEPDMINEFKNDTMWRRSNFDINLSIKQNIQQIDIDDNYTQIENLKIINN